MKQVTKNTLLKQEGKVFEPVKVEDIIYWCESKIISSPHYVVYNNSVCFVNEDYHVINNAIKGGFAGVIFAQSQLNLEEIPVINLNSYVERLSLSTMGSVNSKYHTASGKIAYKRFIEGYNSNTNQYNQKDIEKAILFLEEYEGNKILKKDVMKELFQHINSISVIEVDEKFQIINYE